MKCPDFEQLINYLDGQLKGRDADLISAHLAGCKACAENRAFYEQVKSTTASDDSVAPPAWVLKRAFKIFKTVRSRPRIRERITERIASLVFDSLALPSLVGVRSTATASRQLLYRAGDYSIDLQVAPAEASRADIIGQVLKEGETAFESVAGLKLKLSRGGETIHSTTTDQMGEFAIRGVDYGDYDLRVVTSEGTITVAGLPVIQS
ncbi:MAG TPA: anti-sigma factor [Blastocatellia bacterium]|nr:anti-sigma factor [Blastocatellia bacterium]